jgi:hypothetical protein
VTWYQWLGEVVRLANLKGITATYTEPLPGFATFRWFARGSTWNGVAGAGVGMISMTTPAAFIEYWRGSEARPMLPPEPEYQGEWKRRAGRYVPRIPARATSNAIQELF